MLMRRVPSAFPVLPTVSICLLAGFWIATSTSVLAKGDSALQRVTLSGQHLGVPREVAISLPANYDEMAELPDLGLGDQLPFAVVLHYEFSNGETASWAGRFDGNDRFYFPRPLIVPLPVGSRTWAPAGWYRANPLLADALREAAAPPARLPTTGVQASMETLIVLGFGILLTGMCVRWTGMLRVLTVRLPAGDPPGSDPAPSCLRFNRCDQSRR